VKCPNEAGRFPAGACVPHEPDVWLCYIVCMKRTNLVLDEELLDKATHVLGVKTYSAAVNLALAEVLRIRKIQSLPQFFGRGLWHGDLPEMRDDKLEQHGHSRRRRRGQP
jgi:hypothetical protein